MYIKGNIRNGTIRGESIHASRQRIRSENRYISRYSPHPARIVPWLAIRYRDGGTALLQYTSAATTSDPNGVSIIKWCAYYGDVSAIRFLLTRGESLASLGENFDLRIQPGQAHNIL
jgi:hypothetical protein